MREPLRQPSVYDHVPRIHAHENDGITTVSSDSRKIRTGSQGALVILQASAIPPLGGTPNVKDMPESVIEMPDFIASMPHPITHMPNSVKNMPTLLKKCSIPRLIDETPLCGLSREIHGAVLRPLTAKTESLVQVESLICVPREAALRNGVPWLQAIQSESIAGLSTIETTLGPGTDCRTGA